MPGLCRVRGIKRSVNPPGGRAERPRWARRVAFGLPVLATLAALLLAPPPVQPGGQALTFRSSVDDSDQPYALYLPNSFNPSRKYPLVIGLHGEDTNHLVNLIQLFGAGGTLTSIGLGVGRGIPRLPDLDYIIACPFARGTMGYEGIAETDVYDVLSEVKRKYPIDEDRVYLTGVSMGGGGALRFALTRPDIWAAVAVVAAYTVPGTEELAPNALNLPVRLYHGELDPLVPAASARAWQRRLLDAGAPAEYLEYPGLAHNGWDPAYRNRAIFDWFSHYRRNARPERVRLVTRSFRYGSAYWLRLDGFTSGALASIDARLTGPHEARVETHNVDGFGFTQPVLEAPASVVIDGAALRLKPGAALAFSRRDGVWRQEPAEASLKRLGSEGPIAQAVSSRHVYVYGTADGAPPDVIQNRRLTAERAAQWSAPPRAPLSLRLPVKTDSEVTAADIDTSDLVLFGTKSSNSVIARFAPELPIELGPGAADYGLLFIAPIGKHYALVNSGLPWWTGADQANRGGDQFAPMPFRLLAGFPDFILFKGSLAQVAAEGYFDRNWKLPPDVAEKLAASGTVIIQK